MSWPSLSIAPSAMITMLSLDPLLRIYRALKKNRDIKESIHYCSVASSAVFTAVALLDITEDTYRKCTSYKYEQKRNLRGLIKTLKIYLEPQKVFRLKDARLLSRIMNGFALRKLKK